MRTIPRTPTATAPRIVAVLLLAGAAESPPAAALTLTGLGVGKPVTIKSGVVVTATDGVVVGEGYAVIAKSGEEVNVATGDTDHVLVIEEVIVLEDVTVNVGVLVSVPELVETALLVRVIDGVGGATVPLAEAASLPTVMSMPHASGRVSVAE